MIKQICAYIDEHLGESLSLETLERVFYLDKSLLGKMFKKDTGISIHQYIMLQRMTVCKTIILSDMLLEDVALQLGYSSYSAFYRLFKKTFEISPIAYRKKMLETENKNRD